MDQYLKTNTIVDALTGFMNNSGNYLGGQLVASGQSPKSGEIMTSPFASDPNSRVSFGRQKEIISKSLNTMERKIRGSYYFSPQGAFKIGKYVAGVSGEISQSPNGIIAKNKNGVNTFALDGDTGDATFLGTVTALAGAIGGFTIQSSYLFAGSGSNTAGMSPADYPFFAGATYANRATAPFRVTPAGAMVATTGVIAGWDLSPTTLSKNGIILDSGGLILVGTVNDNISMLVSTVPVVSFMIGGSVKGLMKATTARSGGIAIVGGDMALDNNYAFIAKGTSSNYARFGVTSGNNTWIVSADNDINFLKSDESTMMTISDSQLYVPSKIQLKEISEPSNPGTDNTAFLFLKDNGGKTELCVRFRTGATQVISTEP